MWITLILNDGSGGAEYYGRVKQEDFEDLVEGRITEGFLRVEQLSWLDSESQTGLSLFSTVHGENGQDYGYSDTGYFRVAYIARIIPVREDFVRKGGHV